MAAITAAASSVHMMAVDGERGMRGAGGRVPHRRGVRKTLTRRLSPSTAASIPSRYQTFFYATTENKGFNSRATRFTTHINVDDNPGPGTYTTNTGDSHHTPSFSKKGTGGFASKTKRFARQRKQMLGPGSYNPQPIDNRHDFSSGVGRNFCKPIAVKEEGGGADPAPAPNTYNLSGVHMGRNTLVTAEAAFKSRSRREPPILEDTPAPGHYTVQDDLLHNSTHTHQSVFNSRSKRETLGNPAKGPGPADYSPFPSTNNNREPPQLPYYRQKHYLCISAPAMPLPPLPPSPGPGHYETHKTPDPSHGGRQLGGAMFRSTTSRWDSTRYASSEGPGPGSYNPVIPNKKSYLYNMQRKWI